jgi:hypothetical protein
MRSVLDWLSDFYGPKRNAYLRLSESERRATGKRAMFFFAVVAVLIAVWRWLF